MSMNRTIPFLLLLAASVGCDLAEERIHDEPCEPGEWRTCVTNDMAWGRRYCGPHGWAYVCRTPVCTPGASLACWSLCDHASARPCVDDGFWGSCGPTEECNGVDDDCDGETDEGLVRECWCACNLGKSVCEDGAWLPCDDGTGEECRPAWECGDPTYGETVNGGYEYAPVKLSPGHGSRGRGEGSQGNWKQNDRFQKWP